MKQARVLTPQELNRVLTYCQCMQRGPRNRLAILFSHYAGLRVSEIAALSWGDVLSPDLKPKEVFFLKAAYTKANEARAVHVSKKLQREIRQYLEFLGHRPSLDIAVIRSNKGNHFRPNGLGHLFKKIYLAVNIQDASSHSGRRWFITQLAHSGVSPKVIMELAGHKDLSTTQRYIDVTEDMKRSAVEVL